MGTSSVDIWDNDDAADWIVDLLDTDDLGVLRDSLQPAEVEGRYLEAPEGARILCAADTPGLAARASRRSLRSSPWAPYWSTGLSWALSATLNDWP